MRFVSTRKRARPASFSEAILGGLAPDGGLYVPEAFPDLRPESFDPGRSFAELAAGFLEPFLQRDPLAPQLASICERAFDFPLVLRELEDATSVLELFHGPTAAFKDFGARFLAECFEQIFGEAGDQSSEATILVATSGDTGAAVASAFHGRRGVRVAILFPMDGVSPRQAKHLTCWGGNVASFAVRGSFDDCQRVVKEAFQDPDWRRSTRLTSANSINIGRLLPQAAYHAVTSLWYRHRHGVEPGIIVPSGNMGNAVGSFWAKRLGFPIRQIALACNDNRVVPDWFDSGEWEPRPPVQTLANAMDVGNPSNMERLFELYPDHARIHADASALAVDDSTIREVIAAGPERWGREWCPHTATAVYFREQLTSDHWVIVATAHPAKFDSIVEPLIGRPVEIPESLAQLLSRPTNVSEIEPELDDLRRSMEAALD